MLEWLAVPFRAAKEVRRNKLGVFEAIAIEAKLRKRAARHKGYLVTLHFPSLVAPVHLRAGTSDIGTFRQIFCAREYDISGTAQFKKLVEQYHHAIAKGKRPVVIDCGANIGLSAIWFACQFPEAVVCAVEPALDNLEVMRKNTAPYPNIRIVPGGIWDRNTELSIPNTAVDPWAYEVAEGIEHSEVTIKSHTIPEVLAAIGENHIFIVKIDVEGSEKALFRSNTDWMANVNLFVLEFHDWMYPGQHRSNNFFRKISNFDFDILQKGENLFFFLSQNGKKT